MNLRILAVITFALQQQLVVSQPASPVLDPNLPPNAFTNSPPPEALRGWDAWTVLSRDECTTRREFRYMTTNGLTGEVREKVLGIIEVGNSLNYFDPGSGLWHETLESMQITETGVAAVNGPHKLYCEPNLSSVSAIALVTKLNRIVLTHPESIQYRDPSSGITFELARVNPFAFPELIPPNQCVWRDAFVSPHVKADFVVTYARAGIEADVLFTRRIRPPEQCTPALDPKRAQLQVRHAFRNAGIPRIVERRVGTDLTDQTLDWGDLWFPTGTAFATADRVQREIGQPAALNAPWYRAERAAVVPVIKEWAMDGEVATLTESVRWSDLARKFDDLPEFPSSSFQENVPAAPPTRFAIADSAYQPPGVVIDWEFVASGVNQEFKKFNPPTDWSWYYVTSPVVFTGTVTFQPGCVIKYQRGASLTVTGTIVCNGTPDDPSILTARDDVQFAEPGGFPDYTGCPSGFYANPALFYYSQGGIGSITGMRIRYATTGYRIATENFCGLNYIASTIVEKCQNGIVAENNSLVFPGLGSASFHREVQNPVNTGSCQVYGTFAAQTLLSTHITSGTLALSAAHQPDYSLETWRIFNLDANGFPVSYNPNCWIYGLQGYTSLSPSNGLNVGFTGNDWWDPSCTLITPRHALLVKHKLGPGIIGKSFRFIDTQNTHEVRQCQAYRQVLVNGVPTDMGVMLLSGELPSPTFHKVRALPANAEAKLGFVKPEQYFSVQPRTICYPWGSTAPSPFSVPCIGVNALVVPPPNTSRYAFAIDWHRGYSVLPVDQYEHLSYLQAYLQTSAWIPNRATVIAAGDSGQPVFVLINSELVLLAEWSYSDLGYPLQLHSGAWYGFASDAVNDTIRQMDIDVLGSPTGYTMGVVDLSGFADD